MAADPDLRRPDASGTREPGIRPGEGKPLKECACGCGTFFAPYRKNQKCVADHRKRVWRAEHSLEERIARLERRARAYELRADELEKLVRDLFPEIKIVAGNYKITRSGLSGTSVEPTNRRSGDVSTPFNARGQSSGVGAKPAKSQKRGV